jgi:hypothetical protein
MPSELREVALEAPNCYNAISVLNRLEDTAAPINGIGGSGMGLLLRSRMNGKVSEISVSRHDQSCNTGNR